MKKFLALFLFALAVAACNSCAAPKPNPSPVPVWDGGATVFDAAPPPGPVPGDACGQAEAAAKALGCPLSGTRNGIPWATVCRADQANGVDMHPSCIVSAPDCNAIAACLSR